MLGHPNRTCFSQRLRSRSRFRPGHTPGSPRPPVATSDRTVPVAIDTSLGRIVVALDRLHAPITAGNFLHYVDTHRLDGETFYRAVRIGDGGLIQGGVRSDTRKLFPPIAHESTSKTGLHNVAGSIVMARLQPGTAQADFFILASDTPSYDAGASGRRCRRLRGLRPGRRGHGRGEKDPRLADFSDRGRGRDEGPDARPADQDHQSRAGEIVQCLGGTRRSRVAQRLLQDSGRGRSHDGK